MMVQRLPRCLTHKQLLPHWQCGRSCSRLSASTAALAQVASVIQQVSVQRARLAQPQATPSPPTPEHSPSPASAPASTPASTPAPCLEGRRLDFQLGTIPLIEQRLSINHSNSSQTSDLSQEFVLVAPLDVDQVMDILMEHDLFDSDPYWCRVWPSAIALASIILSRPELVRGKRVADLGAGLGLAGLAAALAGASEVVLLDREPLALQCGLFSALATGGGRVHVQGLRHTLDMAHTDSTNRQQYTSTTGSSHHMTKDHDRCTSQVSHDIQTSSSSGVHVGSHPHTYHFHGPELAAFLQTATQRRRGVEAWSRDTMSTQQEEKGQEGRPACVVRGRVFDWSAGPEALLQDGGRFDVVMACDILYEQDAVTPIAGLVPRMLSSGGRLLLADPPNRTAANRQRFVELLSEAANRVRGARLALEECSMVDGCSTLLLDPEMKGGMCTNADDVIPVQLMVFRSSLGIDTVGIKG